MLSATATGIFPSSSSSSHCSRIWKAFKPVTKPSIFLVRSRFTTPPHRGSTSTSRSGWKRASTITNLEATSVPVRVASELLQAGHHYLDVRTPEEYDAGHVYGSVNVPYLLRIGSGMTKNSNFMALVSTHFDKDDEILIGCQSGKRSLMAVSDLLYAGYTGVMNVAGGYDAWMQSQLPPLHSSLKPDFTAE